MFNCKTTSKDYNEEFFEELYQKYIKNSPWSALRLKHITAMVRPGKGDNILDIGCASGAISDFCGKSGANVTGIDLSDLGVRYAVKKFARENVKFIVADVSSMEMIKNHTYDKAVAADLVEHIEIDCFEKMLREAYRVLKKGGTLSIYTPNPEHLIERLKAKNIILKQNPTHIALRCREEIISAMEKSGFSIDLTYYSNSFIPVFKWMESFFMPLPWLGNYFRYRICVRGVKT